MSREETLILGGVLATVGASLLAVSHAAGIILGWCLFFGGGVVIGQMYWLDWCYGKYRPTPREVNKMSAEKYREHWQDPKFRKWVDHFPPVKDPRD